MSPVSREDETLPRATGDGHSSTTCHGTIRSVRRFVCLGCSSVEGGPTSRLRTILNRTHPNLMRRAASCNRFPCVEAYGTIASLNSRIRRSRRRYAMETLESRTLLAATITATVAGNNVDLTWTGDTTADDVTLTYDYNSLYYSFNDPGHTINVSGPDISVLNNGTSDVLIAPAPSLRTASNRSSSATGRLVATPTTSRITSGRRSGSSGRRLALSPTP